MSKERSASTVGPDSLIDRDHANIQSLGDRPTLRFVVSEYGTAQSVSSTICDGSGLLNSVVRYDVHHWRKYWDKVSSAQHQTIKDRVIKLNLTFMLGDIHLRLDIRDKSWLEVVAFWPVWVAVAFPSDHNPRSLLFRLLQYILELAQKARRNHGTTVHGLDDLVIRHGG